MVRCVRFVAPSLKGEGLDRGTARWVLELRTQGRRADAWAQFPATWLSAFRMSNSMLTGNDLVLFVDRKSIQWGDEWRSRIDTALQQTTFFLPVVTPLFFNSQECRNELLKFSGYARSLGATELLLPLLYVDVRELDENSSDEAKALIAKRQWFDCRHLRLLDEDSEGYSRTVNELAMSLMEIAETISQRPSVTPQEVAVADQLRRTRARPPTTSLGSSTSSPSSKKAIPGG